MSNRHTSEARESHDGDIRIYNPELIIKKLQELYRIVEKVEEESYIQDRSHVGVNCGCAAYHYEAITGKDDYDLGLTWDQAFYLFGPMTSIEAVASRNNWPTFSDLPEQEAALKRIEFVIKEVGG